MEAQALETLLMEKVETRAPYTSAEDLDDYIENVYPTKKPALQRMVRPGLRGLTETWPPWDTGGFSIELPIAAYDPDKERAFKAMVEKDVAGVIEILETYSLWDGWKDTFKVRWRNYVRLLSYGIAGGGGLFGLTQYKQPVLQLIGGIYVLAAVWMGDISAILGPKRIKEKLIENLKKFPDNIEVSYVPKVISYSKKI